MNILITTAISYANGTPHIGHAYELILADTIKNLYQLAGHTTKLLTGTDEHGKKVEQTALAQGKTCESFCQEVSDQFQDLANLLHIKPDYFIRTSSNVHKLEVTEALKQAVGFINLKEVTAWYDVTTEEFKTDKVAALSDFKDSTGKALSKINEVNYCLGLSNFKDTILTTSDKVFNFDFKEVYQEQLNNLKDISISRTDVSWGISFPEDSRHTVYVWFDALLNYVTGSKQLFEEPPKIVHVIGHDIVWFHAGIYPAILEASNLTDYLPEAIVTHRHIVDANGCKFSKSLGNSISLESILQEVSVEALRWYLLSIGRLDRNIPFSIEAVKASYNSFIVKQLGNLVQRLVPLLYDVEITWEVSIAIDVSKFNLQDCAALLHLGITLVKEANVYITSEKIWELESTAKREALKHCLTLLLTACHYLQPYIPESVGQIYKQLNFTEKTIQLTSRKLKVFETL